MIAGDTKRSLSVLSLFFGVLFVLCLFSLEAVAQYKIAITSVGSLPLYSWDGSGNKTANDDLCIYSDNTSHNYSLRVTSTSGSLSLGDGGGHQISLGVYFKGTSGEGSLIEYQEMTYNTSHDFGNANDSASDCPASVNANIKIVALAADIAKVPAGSYGNTLRLTVTPSTT